jgi:hypothetical protein
MPHNDQINYSVKVRLDPNIDPDASVVWNSTNKKFELGTGTGITIINPDDHNMITANGTTDSITGEDYFRYVGGGSSGTSVGRVAIGQYDNATPYTMLDIGRNITNNTTSGFPEAIFYSTNTSFNFGLRLGLHQLSWDQGSGTYKSLEATIGTADKAGSPDTDIYVGKYSSLGVGTFTPIAAFGIPRESFGIGKSEKALIAYSETPTLTPIQATQLNSTFYVGEDVDASSEITSAKDSVAEITNFNTSGNQYNTALIINLAATSGQNQQDWVGSSGSPDDNCRFISFRRRATINEHNNSYPSFIECGKIVLNGAEAAAPSGEIFPGVLYLNTSDKRFKNNIKPLSVGLNELLKIQPSEYNWNQSPIVSKGFIAQDLYKIYPDAVYKPKDETDLSDPWSVDYGKLTPLLVKAIQDQQKIIEGLKERIIKLENSI